MNKSILFILVIELVGIFFAFLSMFLFTGWSDKTNRFSKNLSKSMIWVTIIALFFSSLSGFWMVAYGCYFITVSMIDSVREVKSGIFSFKYWVIDLFQGFILGFGFIIIGIIFINNYLNGTSIDKWF